MISNLSPVAVDTKTAPRDFWTRYHAYRRLRHAETRPDDPVKPDELVEIEMKHQGPFEVQYRYEIARDGQMISDFFAATAKPGSPGYESNKQFMWAAASVHPDHRRRGIGRSWIPLTLELMERHGCTTLTVDTHEESGHQFLKWMGADGKSAGAENRLQLASVGLGHASPMGRGRCAAVTCDQARSLRRPLARGDVGGLLPAVRRHVEHDAVGSIGSR